MKRADHHLIQRVLDGDVTGGEFHAFQERLRGEPVLAELYKEYALLHHTLCEEFEGAHSAGSVSNARSAGVSRWIALAVILALSAAAWIIRPWAGNAARDDVAVVSFSADAVWRIDGPSRSIGGATGVVRGAVLRLLQGRAQVVLNPAVSGLIEGPAELTFVSDGTLRMESGRGLFTRGGNGGQLTVITPRFTAKDSGTEFGIEVPPGGPDELLVLAGSVRVLPVDGGETLDVASGEAVRVSTGGPAERFHADGRVFAKTLGRFRNVVPDPLDRTLWRMEFGNPQFTDARIDGMNYSAFLRLPAPEPESSGSVLLATLDVGKPASGMFHTDGWAGMSFFNRGTEMLFYGDSYGTEATWSLDVKQRIPVILPEHPVAGERMVTLRYERRTGRVTLHEGGLPLKPPFCSGKIPPETTFDEIRIGASSGAALAVKSLVVSVGGE